MNRILVIGAGVTGCYSAARLFDRGADVSLLARGDKADRLEREGLRLRDGISGAERTVRLPVVREGSPLSCDLVMVCVQAIHRPAVEHVVSAIQGRPIVWFLGNSVRGYDEAGRLLGTDRVIGGFPDVGGTWDGDVLVYADRFTPDDAPFDRPIGAEAFPESAGAWTRLKESMAAYGLKVVPYRPILAWHLCHVALITPMAAALYRHDGDLNAAAADREYLMKAMKTVGFALRGVKRRGYPVLPARLRPLRLFPRITAVLGTKKFADVLESPFGAIALAGHANTARAEMRHLARELLELIGGDDGVHRDVRTVLESI